MDNYSSGYPGGEEGYHQYQLLGYAAAAGGGGGSPPPLVSAAIATTYQPIPYTTISYSSSFSTDAVNSGPLDIFGDPDVYRNARANGAMFVDQEEIVCDSKSSEYEDSEDLKYHTDESSEDGDLFIPRRRDTVERSPLKSPPAPYYGRLARAGEIPMDLLLQTSSSDDEEEIKKFDNYAEYSAFKYARACKKVFAVEKQRDKEAARRRRMTGGTAADDDEDENYAYGGGATAAASRSGR